MVETDDVSGQAVFFDTFDAQSALSLHFDSHESTETAFVLQESEAGHAVFPHFAAVVLHDEHAEVSAGFGNGFGVGSETARTVPAVSPTVPSNVRAIFIRVIKEPPCGTGGR